MKNQKIRRTRIVTSTGTLTGAGVGTLGVISAVNSVSSAAPAAFVPYAAMQVGASQFGISSLLGGAAATSSFVAGIGGPIVVAGAAVALPAVIVGGIFYGISKLFE